MPTGLLVHAGSAPDVGAQLATASRPSRLAEQTGPATEVRTAPASVPSVAVPGPSTEAEPSIYGVAGTYWLDAAEQPVTAAVRFVGTKVDAGGSDVRFERVVAVPRLARGAGRASVTAVVQKLPAGTWQVSAQGEDETGRPAGSGQREELVTRLGPLAHGPGVRPAAWPTLVLLGVVLAVIVQVLLVRRDGLDASAAALSAIGATLVGYLTAKLAYMVMHRVPPSGFPGAGTLIQGFLVGSFGSLIAFTAFADLPVRRLLDLTAPGVFAAMALARPGCWLGGCCAGRPTTSRWGLWSSDRIIGVRRIPVQLMESGLAALIASLGLLLVLTTSARPSGIVLALSAALYTLGRQGLFPLRAEARRTSRGRLAAAMVAALIAATSVALLVMP